MAPKLPRSKSDWAAVALAISLIAHGVSRWLCGDHMQAFVDFSGALGTVGLPSLLGSGYHVEIVKDFEP